MRLGITKLVGITVLIGNFDGIGLKRGLINIVGAEDIVGRIVSRDGKLWGEGTEEGKGKCEGIDEGIGVRANVEHRSIPHISALPDFVIQLRYVNWHSGIAKSQHGGMVG